MKAALHEATRARIIVPLLCLGFVLNVALAPDSVFDASRNFVFDAYQRLAPGPPPTSDVILIDVDAESIRRLGQWPWPRNRLARLIDAAASARVIGVDVLLSESDRLSPNAWAAAQDQLAPEIRAALAALPDTDARLTASIARAPVVLAAVASSSTPALTPTAPAELGAPIFESGDDARDGLPRYAAAIEPLQNFAEAARGIGFVSALPEPDGILRRIPAVIAIGPTLRPALAIEMMRVAAGAAGRIDFSAGPFGLRRIAVDGRTVETDRAGRVWLRYGAAPARGTAVPAYRVLEGSVEPAMFRDRIVLIGASAAGLGDVVVSPMRRQLAGVEVQRQLLENLLIGRALWRPGFALGLEVAAALGFSLVAMAWLGRQRDRTYALLFAGVAAVTIAGSFAAFWGAGLLLDWTMPLSALAATMLAALAARIHDEVRARLLREGELAVALMQAEAADRAKTEFLANASHELRTPLTAVIGFSEIMTNEMMGPLSPVYSDYARSIHQSGAHLLSVIDDVLDLSVIDLGGMQPKDEPIEIARLIADCERMVAMRAADRSVLVRPELSAGLPTLIADPRMVRQMLLNLLSNAIKYSPRQGRVVIAAWLAPDGWLAIAVCDAGPGIAAADIPYAMQRFGRLRSASMAQEPGIGIGLPLTKSMVELHDGRFELKSEVGVGTEALLWFPPARLGRRNDDEERNSR
jgi:signal transduction histidine kinase